MPKFPYKRDFLQGAKHDLIENSYGILFLCPNRTFKELLVNFKQLRCLSKCCHYCYSKPPSGRWRPTVQDRPSPTPCAYPCFQVMFITFNLIFSLHVQSAFSHDLKAFTKKRLYMQPDHQRLQLSFFTSQILI